MLRNLIPLVLVLGVGLVAPARSQPAETPPAPVLGGDPAPSLEPLAAVPRISAVEAKKAIDAGKAVLVDVRAANAFQAEHAKGAINIPTFEMVARYGELPRNKQIITYCT